jgi:mono/diheme cytochrome c family protein
MKLVKLALILATLALVTIGCNNPASVTTNNSQPDSTASAPTATPDELASARLNFKTHCVACHGERGEGGRVEVEGKKLKVPALREGHALDHPDEKFVKQITEGDDEMPDFNDKLKPEEINELVRFIRKEIQGKQ